MATQTIIDPAARAYRTLNPATGEVIREFQTLDDTEARARLDRAHAPAPSSSHGNKAVDSWAI
jgi:succinate-semialdehyde dehydrogenase / glutarate-semialdehyde dehydrogenase